MTDPKMPGRPAVGPQVKMAFSPGMLTEIDQAATLAGMTRSAWVRQACARALAG